MNINEQNVVERPDPFNSYNANKHGCIWFEDNPENKGPRDPNKMGGWACVGGAEPFHFEKVADLPLDIIWWTNLSKSENWSFGKLKRFKESAVFGIDLISLISENGSINDKRSATVKYWSEIFARAADWLSRWAEKNHDTPWDWGEGSLADAMRRKLLPADETENMLIENALSKGYIENIVCEVKSQKLEGKRQIVLSLPRLKHAQKILSSRYPKKGWSLLRENDWPKSTSEKIKWVMEKKQPLLIEVDMITFKDMPIRQGDTSLSVGEMWLGKRGFKLSSQVMEPVWITETELMALAKFANFEIISAYISPGWDTIVNVEDIIDTEEGPLIQLSMTKGLLATSTWQSLASPGRDPNNRRKGVHSPRAVWMRVTDRLSCFSAALIMQSRGYDVLSYGNGQVKITFDPQGDANLLAKTTQQAGLILPTILAERLPLNETTKFENLLETQEGVSSVDQWLKHKWSIKKKTNESLTPLYLDIDRLILPWIGKEKTAEILKKTALRLLSLNNKETKMDNWWEHTLKEQTTKSVERIKINKNK